MIDGVRRWLRRAVGPDFSRRYRWNLHPRNSASQGGEDGNIAEIFRRLGVEQGWFVRSSWTCDEDRRGTVPIPEDGNGDSPRRTA